LAESGQVRSSASIRRRHWNEFDPLRLVHVEDRDRSGVGALLHLLPVVDPQADLERSREWDAEGTT
jgi:hypothetical protein